MRAFDEWFRNIEKEYPLFQDKDGYTIGNTRALKVGWKAALEWINLQVCPEAWDVGDVEFDIEQELKEE